MTVIPIVYLAFFLLPAAQSMAAPPPPSNDSRSPSPSNAIWLEWLRPVHQFTQTIDSSNSQATEPMAPKPFGTPPSPPHPNSVQDATPSRPRRSLKLGTDPYKLSPLVRAAREDFYRDDAKLKALGRTNFTPETLALKEKMLRTLSEDASFSCIRNFRTTRNWLEKSIEEQRRDPTAHEPASLRGPKDGPYQRSPSFRRLRKEIEEDEIEMIFVYLQGDALSTAKKNLLVKYQALVKDPAYTAMSRKNPIRDKLKNRIQRLKRNRKDRPTPRKQAEPPGINSAEHGDYLELLKELEAMPKSNSIPRGVKGIADREKVINHLERIQRNEFYKGLPRESADKKRISSMLTGRKDTMNKLLGGTTPHGQTKQ